MLLLPPQTTPLSLHIHILIHHTLPLASPLARKHCGVSKLRTSLSESSIVLCIWWSCKQNPLLHNSQRNNNMNTTLTAVYLCNASSVWCHFQGSTCNSTGSIVELRDLKLGVHIHKSDMFRNRGTVSTQAFLPLPLGFFARSRSAASVGSSAAAPASGSPAGRNPSRVRGPQLVPEHRDERGKERKRQIVFRKLNTAVPYW